MTEGVALEFCAREQPLPPIAALALGACSSVLARRLLARTDEHLLQLRAVAGPEAILVFANEDSLPWVDGITYLGQDPFAPSLLLPTHLVPTVPVDMLERAILRRIGRHRPPIVVVPGKSLFLSFAQAHPVHRDRVRAWLGEAE